MIAQADGVKFAGRRCQRSLRLLPWIACALVFCSPDTHAADDAALTVTYKYSSSAIKRTIEHHAVPALNMVREDGVRVTLDRELNDGRPVILNFIYTSCTTICPLSSQEFGRLQQRLGPDHDRVHLVSISVDPEEDTPATLRAYARHFGAAADWDYYTGSIQNSRQAQIAFNVYRGDKMTHAPVTLLRATPASDWVRLDGFATADDLYAELRNMHSAP